MSARNIFDLSMSQIVTITFSPCLDKNSSVEAFIPEKKLKCALPVVKPGGGGINVARGLHRLGSPVSAIYPIGGFMGQMMQDLMDKEGLHSMTVKKVFETRENVIITDRTSNQQFRFGMPDHPLSENELEGCLRLLDSAEDIRYIIASGSLPEGVPDDIYVSVARIARSKNAKFILDTSGEPLRAALREGVYMIKPNLGELSNLAGKGMLNHQDVIDVSQTIIEKGGCEIAVISMGKEGAMVVSKDFAHLIPSPPVTVQSTVGAGDSMVAGIVHAMSQGKDVFEAVQFGVACGTATTICSGSELFNPDEAFKLFDQIRK